MIFGIGTETVMAWAETSDRFGDRVYTHERVIYGCAFAPRTSEESTSQRTATVRTGLTLYAPPTAALTAHTRIRRADGTLWAVDGEPGLFKNPIGGTVEGEQAHLVRVTG